MFSHDPKSRLPNTSRQGILVTTLMYVITTIVLLSLITA
jgi:hypothetical protein